MVVQWRGLFQASARIYLRRSHDLNALNRLANLAVTALSSTEAIAGYSPFPSPPPATPPPLRYKEASAEERVVTAKKCTKECDACANCYFFEVLVAVAVVVVKASK